MGWNNGILTLPIGWGDISRATGVGGPPYDLGNMIVNGTSINAMAKYKPVRHSNRGILSLSERASTRYGFGAAMPQLTLSDNEPENIWTYLRPRGVKNTSLNPTSTDEWFRALDFDGYASDACAPLATSVGNLTYDDWSNILVFVNGLSNSLRPDMTRRWVADRSLSIGELLEGGGENRYDNYVSFLLIDTQDWSKNLIVTNTTFRTLVNNGGNGTFRLNAQGERESGLDYPAIPILSSSRNGHTFRVVVCLATMQPSAGNAYEVYTSNLASYIPYSLGFEAGADRASAKLESGQFKMDATTMSSITLTATDMVTELPYNGYVWRAFSISAEATFSTADVHYSGTEKTINGTLTLSNSMTFNFGPTPGSGDPYPLQIGTAARLAGETAGQTRIIGSTDNQHYLWVMKNNGALIRTTVEADVSYTHPFNQPLTGHGSTTIG